ncbi:MAG: hypothetical protein ABFD24_03545 [Anaerolineaceae bacterium]
MTIVAEAFLTAIQVDELSETIRYWTWVSKRFHGWESFLTYPAASS